MRNLHRIYEPPIPKHLIPTNNPFYNKQMLVPASPSKMAPKISELGMKKQN
jgi:hypothetical protein